MEWTYIPITKHIRERLNIIKKDKGLRSYDILIDQLISYWELHSNR
jgi:hypothetical protein